MVPAAKQVPSKSNMPFGQPPGVVGTGVVVVVVVGAGVVLEVGDALVGDAVVGDTVVVVQGSALATDLVMVSLLSLGMRIPEPLPRRSERTLINKKRKKERKKERNKESKERERER